jgi:hypothetical protein
MLDLLIVSDGPPPGFFAAPIAPTVRWNPPFVSASSARAFRQFSGIFLQSRNRVKEETRKPTLDIKNEHGYCLACP